MLEMMTINPGAAKKPSMDFLGLREEAMEVIRKLAGETWTDHNLHDPGITILEQICYALTDLGYRLNFSVPELLADAAKRDGDKAQIGWKKGAEAQNADSLPAMPPMEDMLPSAPYTLEDWQRIFLDIPGTRAMEILPVSNASPQLFYNPVLNEVCGKLAIEPGLVPIRLSGLFKVLVDSDQGFAADARREFFRQFYSQRPACEEIQVYQQLEPGKLVINADFSINLGTDPEEVLAELLFKIDQRLSPQARFKRRAEMEKVGRGTDEIFEGPLLKNGFLLEEELQAVKPQKSVFLSQVFEEAYSVDGIKELRNLSINSISPTIVTKGSVEQWVPRVSEGTVPRLELDLSQIVIRQGEVVINYDSIEVKRLFEIRRQEAIGRIPEAIAARNLATRDREIAAYQSLQHQFPDNYGINAGGLPRNSDISRLTRAHQLKAYLLFFEQILSDYFSMAGGLGKIFQFADAEFSTFSQGSLEDVPLIDTLEYANREMDANFVDAAELKALDRLQRLLEHLLARFGETMVSNLSLSEEAQTSVKQRRLELLRLQLSYFHKVPWLSKFRGQGMRLSSSHEQQVLPSGLKQRIAYNLGIRPDEPDFVKYPNKTEAIKNVDFLMIEHILLRPLPMEYGHENMFFRFRNGHIWKILRFRSIENHSHVRYECYSTGTGTLVEGDEIEILFDLFKTKIRATILSVDSEKFTIAVPFEFSEKGNPQRGSWNKSDTEGVALFADPWSLQVSYILNGDAPRFATEGSQNEAENILRQETPAHIAVLSQWQTGPSYQRIVDVYAKWKTAYSAYLQDRIDKTDAGKLYLNLRSIRDELLRLLVAGETEPARDFRFVFGNEYGTNLLKNGDAFEVYVPNQDLNINFSIPEIEPSVDYSVLMKTEAQTWEEASNVNAIISPEANGLHIEIPHDASSEPTIIFAVQAAYQNYYNSSISVSEIKRHNFAQGA